MPDDDGPDLLKARARIEATLDTLVARHPYFAE